MRRTVELEYKLAELSGSLKAFTEQSARLAETPGIGTVARATAQPDAHAVAPLLLTTTASLDHVRRAKAAARCQARCAKSASRRSGSSGSRASW